jgi:hypothetical protein
MADSKEARSSISQQVEVGDAVEVVRANDMRSGWSPREIRVRSSGELHRLDARYSRAKEMWNSAHASERSDKKASLRAFSTTNGLTPLKLTFDETEWSEVQPFHQVLRSQEGNALREELLPSISNSMELTFPNITTIHGILATADDKIVISERSAQATYHPGRWSASFEEQVEPRDLEVGNAGLHVAADRGVEEEFPYDCIGHQPEFRLFALAVEYTILTPFVVAFAEIDCDSTSLHAAHEAARLGGKDVELGPLRFVPFELEPLAQLLITDQLGELCDSQPVNWHPTSKYRLLLAGLHRFGESELSRALGHELNSAREAHETARVWTLTG